MAENFWKVIEKTLKNYEIQSVIKHSINLSGYCNPLVFKNLTDDDIDKMEKFMREKALGHFAESLSKSIDSTCDVLLDDETLLDIFGEKYAHCPEKFEFLPGERCLIKVLVAHVKKLVDGNGENTGLQKFNVKTKKGKNNSAHLMQAINQIVNENNTCTPSPVENTKHRQLTDLLLGKLVISLQMYGVDVAECNGSLIEVDKSGTYGNIKCPLCDETAKPRRVYYHNSSGKRSSYWVLSNYEKHLKKVHLLVANRSKDVKIQNANIESIVSSASNLMENGQNVTPVNFMNESQIKSEKTNSTDLLKMDQLIESKSKDDSLQYCGVVSNPAPKGEDSDFWLCMQMSEQIQQMVAATLINGEAEHTMEFHLTNQPVQNISVISIAPDGNCLFSALSHQLWPNQITSSSHAENVKKLRSVVIEHILKPENFPKYEFILRDRLPKVKTILTEAELTTECKLFVRYVLSRNGVWGGLETIKAVSTEFQVNIVIINECGTCNMVRTANEYNQTLLIAYQNYGGQEKDHYNSVSDMSSEAIYSAAAFIIKK